MTPPRARTLTLCGAGLAAMVALSIVSGFVDYSRAKSGRRVMFSRAILTAGVGRTDYVGLGYRLRTWKTVSAGPMVPVPRDSVGANPNYFYTARGAELRFVLLPHTFEAVHHFKWLSRHLSPPPTFSATDSTGGT